MLTKKLFIITLLLNACKAQNILNFLDFAAPVFGLLKSGRPEVCYNELGCFRNDGPFSRSSFRPISCVPQSPQIIGTEFLFHSRLNPNDPQTIEAIDTHLYNQIDFNPNLNTKIIIHGYKEGLLIQGFAHDTYDVLKDELLSKEDSNVILVRWNRGASGFYFQAVANTRVVGAQIALLIKYFINERNGRPQLFHLIGFSLGAHISGYAGKVTPNLGRITALDAAKPYFDGVPNSIRVHASDALFVDAFHTDNDIGTAQAFGHSDIYLNGGNLQPGCERQITNVILNEGFLDGFFETVSCDHKRSLHYFADFIFNSNTHCIPIAYRCESWLNFISGHCVSCGRSGEDCAVVGLTNSLNSHHKYHRDINTKFYIMTNDRQPYCVYQYLVRIATNQTQPRIDGKFHMRIHSYNHTFNDYKSRLLKLDSLNRVSENKASFVISSHRPLNEIRKIDLTFIKQNNFKGTQNAVYVNSMQLMPLNIIDDNEKMRNSIIYCTDGNRWVANTDQQSTILLQTRNCI